MFMAGAAVGNQIRLSLYFENRLIRFEWKSYDICIVIHIYSRATLWCNRYSGIVDYFCNFNYDESAFRLLIINDIC